MTDVTDLFKRMQSGDRTALGQAITLTESSSARHRAQAAALLDLCVKQERDTFRFCVSGAPGVGKSTLIESLGKRILKDHHKLAVLTIDPSSQISHGAILGDKTRMPDLSRHPEVFIRPTAAGAALGGVADRTREVILLCEAAGYEIVCVETVGVGQSETRARAMTDFFLLLVLPGGGDELQGIKRGIVEIADLIAITRADGDSLKLASQTRRNYLQAMHLFAPKSHMQPVEVRTCSAVEDEGIAELWEIMCAFRKATATSGYLAGHRAQQDLDWLDLRLRELAREIVLSSPQAQQKYQELREKVRTREISISAALVKLEEMIRPTFTNGL